MHWYRALLVQFGHTRWGLFLIRTVIWRYDRFLYRLTNGRVVSSGPMVFPTLLLTVTGRTTGKAHTLPLLYYRDRERLILVCADASGPGSRQWPKNVLANPDVEAQIRGQTARYRARRASDDETARYWPALVEMYPPYATYAQRFAETIIFVLEPSSAEKAVTESAQ